MEDIKNQSKLLLRISDVSGLTTLGKSTINLWVSQNRFPKPLKISPTLKVWEKSQLIKWITEQRETNG